MNVIQDTVNARARSFSAGMIELDLDARTAEVAP